MPRGWSWDFEEERALGEARDRGEQPGSHPARPPARPPRPPLPPDPDFGRRRLAALIGVLVTAGLVVLVAALSGSGHHRTPAGRPSGAPIGSADAKAPEEKPEDEQQSAVSAVLAYTPFVKEGSARRRDIALTFDDGPGPYTPRVLDVLESYHVHATFFLIGKMLRYFSESAKREIRDGDVIGDHTETHPMMAELSSHDQHEELFEQIARVELLGGSRPDLFRPPYGSFDATTLRLLHQLHLLMVLWSVDTDDYQQPGVATIVSNALAGAHPGAIILMHDAGGTRTETIEALPTIIRSLRARGFRLVTVPRLLADDPPPAGQPIPPNLSGD